MSAAPTHPARPPPPGRCHQPLSGAFIVPPVPHASRSFVLAATRLRALRLDPLVTGSELPFAEQTPKKTRIRPLAPGPRLHREGVGVAGPAQLRNAAAYSAAWAGVSLPETRSSAGPLVKVYSPAGSGAFLSSCPSRCRRIVALLASAKTSTEPPFGCCRVERLRCRPG